MSRDYKKIKAPAGARLYREPPLDFEAAK